MPSRIFEKIAGRWLRLALASLTAALLWQPVVAQNIDQFQTGTLSSPVLVVDLDQVFLRSAFGQRVEQDSIAAQVVLQSEFDVIIDALNAEEGSLTERRPDMAPEDFRVEAEAFDEKVQQIRVEQDARVAALRAAVENSRRVFLDAIEPILGQIMNDRGAVVIIDRRNVRLFAQGVDITNDAVVAIDSVIGDGDGVPVTDTTEQ